MTLGTGIFLSSIIIGLIILFSLTRDHWNWKKISKIAGIALVSIITGLVILFFFVSQSEKFHPQKITSFYGVNLRSSPDDVLFSKGEPDYKKDSNLWSYYVDSCGERIGQLNLHFENNKVDAITFVLTKLGGFEPSLEKNMNYLKCGSTLESIERFFGKTNIISKSPNGLSRTFWYDKYNVAFTFRKGVVSSYGIFDAETWDKSNPNVISNRLASAIHSTALFQLSLN